MRRNQSIEGHQGRPAIDGTKIHACAKESRFHREGTINEKLEAARRHLDAVNKEAEDKDARASVTDPEARIMQVSKGAYAPGFNVQVATDMDTGVILGSVLLQDNDDSHGLPKVVPEIEKNTGKSPTILATDVKYTNHGHLDYCDREDMSLYSPPAEEQDKVKKSSPGNGYLKENSEIDVEACELTCPAGNIFKLYKNPPSVGAHKFQFKRRKKTLCVRRNQRESDKTATPICARNHCVCVVTNMNRTRQHTHLRKKPLCVRRNQRESDKTAHPFAQETIVCAS